MDRVSAGGLQNLVKSKWFLFTLLLLFLTGPLNGIIAQAASSENVIDQLAYLSTDDSNQIQLAIDDAVTTYNLDIVIVITDYTEGKSSRDFADDYYDYNGFGIGPDASGLLMLINMDEHELWISTTGDAVAVYTDDRITNILDVVAPYLSDGNYYQASMAFVRQVELYAAMGPPKGNEPGGVDPNYPGGADPNYPNEPVPAPTYWEKVLRNMASPLVYLIGIVLAVVGVLIASAGNKGKVTISNRTYEEGGSFQLVDQRDDFINQTVTRVRIPKNDTSSGGGSSVHRGSSGRSHGGGGRKF